MTTERTDQPRRRVDVRVMGFSLIEMLVCITILAVAVFPLLLVKEQCLTDATDAKLSRICRNQIQTLLSQAMVDLEPGKRLDGSLEDIGYPGIYYEMECEELDLSTEITESSERKTEEEKELFRDQEQDRERRSFFDDDPDGDGESDGYGLFAEEDEVEIDPRFRCRHIRITLYYYLGTGDDAEEVKIFAETYIPALPEEDSIFLSDGRDLVPPNDGN